jgi:putative transposase
MRLKVTKNQDNRLDRLLDQLCAIYNMALDQRKLEWENSHVALTYYDQQSELVTLRSWFPEYAELPSAIERDPLRRLQRAFDGFYRRVKSGETPGYPRFRSSERYDSFTVDSYSFKMSKYEFVIGGIGGFKFKTHYKIKGTPKEFRVKRIGNKWQGQVVCDIGPAPEKAAVRNATGIDVGLTTLATLSDGTEIPNPRWTRKEEDRLAKANRSLSRKIRGSKNSIKAREHLRRVHQRISGLRSSYLTGVAKQLVGEYDLIAHEDLKISNMVQSMFAKSILDAAWGQLIFKLNSEAECAGKWVIPVNPRGTTQICSGCGEKVPKKIWDRHHDCPKCGLSLGRDHNAALNILRLGESLASKQNCILATD